MSQTQSTVSEKLAMSNPWQQAVSAQVSMLGAWTTFAMGMGGFGKYTIADTLKMQEKIFGL